VFLIKSIGVIVIVGVVVIAIPFFLGVIEAPETRDILSKIMYIFGVFALGGVSLSFISRSEQASKNRRSAV
jgi:ABC-type multidrug transport system permease subunit